MSIVKCIVIDGWHKGHVVNLPQALPTIRLPRPAVVTTCDCDGEEEIYEVAPSANDYFLAFKATDGKSAIYTVKGDSEPMVSNRDWHTYANNKPWADTPLIVGCHDDKAVFEHSLQLNTGQNDE